MVSLRPVSQSETFGASARRSRCRARKRRKLRRIWANISRPRTSAKALGSAASNDTRSSSSPASMSSRPRLGVRRVPLVLKRTWQPRQIADHARQIRHHHRLADPCRTARATGKLVDDRGEQLPAHVRRPRAPRGARTGRAEQVAAIRRFQIKTTGSSRLPGPVGRRLARKAPRVRASQSTWLFRLVVRHERAPKSAVGRLSR